MGKGLKTHIVYDETDYNSGMFCGYYIQGRPSLQKIKIRLHIKNCAICQTQKNNSNEISHEFFKKEAPQKLMRGIVMRNSGLRACDR